MIEEQQAPAAPEADEGQAPEATEVVEAPVMVEESAPEAADDEESARSKIKKANREAQNLRERLRKFEEAEEKRKREAMSELEALKADKEASEAARAESESKAQEAVARAQRTAIRSQAMLVALRKDVGAKPERVEAVLELAKLSNAADYLNDDGEPDEKAIAKSLQAVLKNYPEFRAKATDVGDASNPPGEPPDANPGVWNMSKEQFEEQMKRIQYGERFVPS